MTRSILSTIVFQIKILAKNLRGFQNLGGLTPNIFLNVYILIFLWGVSFYPFAYAANLERLFTTHKERGVLDAGRPPKITVPPPTDAGGPEKGALEPEPPPLITFNGLVTRSQGPAIVWFNDSNELVQQGFIVELDKMQGITVPIFLSKAQQRCFLKPGQTLNTRDKRVQEKFEPAQENPDEVKLSCINLTRHNQELP